MCRFVPPGAVAALLLLLAACAPPTSQPRPNFVFILVDDLGWADVGCFGSTFYETPNLDSLAASGMRFTDAYAACPVCSPTRASIMTGKYPARLNLTDWIPGRQSTHGADPSDKLLPPAFEQQLVLKERTIAEALRDSGYRTFFAGKWHLGDAGHYPEDQGFGINIGGLLWGHPKGGYFSPYGNPKLPDGPEGEYLTDRLTTESLDFLEIAGAEPFFLYLSYYSVHNPMQAKESLIDKYQTKAQTLPSSTMARFLPEGTREARQVQDYPIYAAMIHSVDENVGRILKKLDELGLKETTVVVFMSDNGGLSTSEGSPTSNLPLRGGKGWLYEGGIREPMIVSWPGRIKAGSICREPVISNDFYPTILELAELQLIPQQHADGVSLAPLLTDSGTIQRQALFWHYPHYSNQGGRPGAAVRVGDYKLLEFYEEDRAELYNLEADIGERRDLSGRAPEKTNELRSLLQAWRESVGANMPRGNSAYDPSATHAAH